MGRCPANLVRRGGLKYPGNLVRKRSRTSCRYHRNLVRRGISKADFSYYYEGEMGLLEYSVYI